MTINPHSPKQLAILGCYHERERLKRDFGATWHKAGKAWLVHIRHLDRLIATFPRAVISEEAALQAAYRQYHAQHILDMLYAWGFDLDANEQLVGWDNGLLQDYIDKHADAVRAALAEEQEEEEVEQVFIERGPALELADVHWEGLK